MYSSSCRRRWVLVGAGRRSRRAVRPVVANSLCWATFQGVPTTPRPVHTCKDFNRHSKSHMHGHSLIFPHMLVSFQICCALLPVVDFSAYFLPVVCIWQGTAEASRAVLRRALETIGVAFGPTTPEQALITLMRAVGGDASSAPYERLVDNLEGPGGFQQGL